MRKVTLVSMLAIVMVAALAVPAQAVLVRNADSLELLFFDDFEGPAPFAFPNNGAYPGSWSGVQSPAPSVRDQATAPGGHTPYEQNQMVYINPGNNASPTIATFSSALTTGDNMHAELAVMGLTSPDPYGDYHHNIRFATSGGGNAFQFYAEGGYVGSSATNFTSLIWDTTVGNWNLLEVDYVLGSTSMTVTLLTYQPP